MHVRLRSRNSSPKSQAIIHCEGCTSDFGLLRLNGKKKQHRRIKKQRRYWGVGFWWCWSALSCRAAIYTSLDRVVQHDVQALQQPCAVSAACSVRTHIRHIYENVWQIHIGRPMCVHVVFAVQKNHTYLHTYIHTYIRTYIHACIHTYIHTYINTHIHTHRQTDRQTDTHTHIHTYTHTHIRTYTHIYIYIYVYMCMCICIRICICICMCMYMHMHMHMHVHMHIGHALRGRTSTK